MGTPTNFPDGLALAGAPVIAGGGNLPLGNTYWFVSSTTGSDTFLGTWDNPFATLSKAISRAADGDIIVLKPSHAETVIAAGGITVNVANLTIVGLGNGNGRPTFTFSTATTASILISSAGVKILNVVGISGIDALSQPFDVRAAGCTLQVEWQDSLVTVEAARAVLGSAAADRLTVNLKYIGQSGGDACVNAVRLVGSDNATINCDFYGKASTAWVEFLTTACTNVEVYGYMYNSGTTNGSKDVVDTVTGSTWFASFYDGAAGSQVSGGSAAALSIDDFTTGATVATADGTANAYERDVVGNKTDAAVYVAGTTKSLAAYAKGHADLQERVALSATAVMVNGNTIFTVAGGPIEITALVSVCVTGNGATASTLQYSVTPTIGAGAQTISAASASLANATAGGSVTLAGTALSTAALYNANGPNLIANPGTIYCPAGTITIVIGVGSTTGTWQHFIRYKPLTTGVTVS